MEEDLELFQEQAVTKYVMTYSLGSWIYDGIELCMFIKNAKCKILMILEAIDSVFLLLSMQTGELANN